MLELLLNVGMLAQVDAGGEESGGDLVTTQIAPFESSLLLPPPVTTNASSTDVPFQFALWIGAATLLLIIGVMLYFGIRYRRRSPDQKPRQSAANDVVLQFAWTVIPFVLFMDLFYVGFRGFMDVSHVPSNAMEISVGVADSKWSFTYPDGHIDEALHVPVNKPVKLTMESDESIHSLSIPAFRLKRDVLPDKSTTAWFEATQPGEYLAMCARYCGAAHSGHWAWVVVHEQDEFEAWQEQAGGLFNRLSIEEVGEVMYTRYICNTCHSLDGTKKVGPSFKGIFGRETTLTGGLKITADEKYIRDSVLDPQAAVVEGYPPAMPAYKGQIKDRELQAIIEYLKTLQQHPALLICRFP